MEHYSLRITLQSDTTLGRGEGVAGLVDAEVEHDAYGLPYLRGRTLKGLLVEACANLLFSLRQFMPAVRYAPWEEAARTLFGVPGGFDTLEDEAPRPGTAAGLHIGDARLPRALRSAVQVDVAAQRYTPADVLASLTAIRRQTAMDASGVPEPGSLRSVRVLLRGLSLTAPLYFVDPPGERDLALLAACARALRRVGTARNRGRGRVLVELHTAQGAPLDPDPLPAGIFGG
jgi:hypothetical protein